MELFVYTFLRYSDSILPWFLVGLVATYFLEKKINHKTISRHFGNLNFRRLVTVQVLGMISPLSIMSFMPLAGELEAMGFNSGLLLSFFIAERAYDLQSFFIIIGLFGARFALLNALAIFISLIVTALFLRHEFVRFTVKDRSIRNGYWKRQGKLLLLIFVGITLGSLLRTFIPQRQFDIYAGGNVSGLVVSLVLGFILYFGPILGNYPVAKALSDLGMSTLGTFSFLTVSPIFNSVIIFIFGATVGMKHTLKALLVYSISAVALSIIFSLLV